MGKARNTLSPSYVIAKRNYPVDHRMRHLYEFHVREDMSWQLQPIHGPFSYQSPDSCISPSTFHTPHIVGRPPFSLRYAITMYYQRSVTISDLHTTEYKRKEKIETESIHSRGTRSTRKRDDLNLDFPAAVVVVARVQCIGVMFIWCFRLFMCVHSLFFFSLASCLVSRHLWLLCNFVNIRTNR